MNPFLFSDTSGCLSTRWPALVGILAFWLVGCRAHGPKPAANASPLLLHSPGTATNVASQTASDESTKEMAELLRTTARSIAPRELVFGKNKERARLMHEMLVHSTDADSRETMRLSYAIELLRAGDTQKALDELARTEQQLKRSNPLLWNDEKQKVQLLQVAGSMRLGEEQNCCAVNNPNSCLIPIRGAGIHTRQAGSTRAMQLLREILQEHPDDPQARWLLNIAAMTVGQYPEGVPSQWRISPTVFQSEYDIKRFPNIASPVGLNVLGLWGGAVVDDLDGDGEPRCDGLCSGLAGSAALFHNNGDATFTERTKEARLTGETGGLNMIQADYDNDGHTDILLLRGGWMGTAGRFPSSLLRNNGDGTFADVTKQAGLMRAGPTQTASGWITTMMGGWICTSATSSELE